MRFAQLVKLHGARYRHTVIALDGNFDMASRLAYFIWDSPPDAALFTAAAGNKLGDAGAVRAQVGRMIQDQRFARGLAEPRHRGRAMPRPDRVRRAPGQRPPPGRQARPPPGPPARAVASGPRPRYRAAPARLSRTEQKRIWSGSSCAPG